jgi:hypothetical protein
MLLLSKTVLELLLKLMRLFLEIVQLFELLWMALYPLGYILIQHIM